MTKLPQKTPGKRPRDVKAGKEQSPTFPWKLALVVFAAAFALYAGTLGHDFVWDDRDLIVDNPAVQKLDAESFQSIFLENFWRNVESAGGYYRPIVTLSYHLDYRFHGADASGFHLSNVLFHATASTLAFVFLYLLFGQAVLALVAGLLFAAHPIHTENVAWVAGRTDLLAALWMFAALVLYVRARRGRLALFLPLSLVAFMLALMSKESAACLPLIIALLEFGPFGHLLTGKAEDAVVPAKRGRAITITASFLGVFAAWLLLRHHVLGIGVTSYHGYAPGIAGSVALPLSIVGGYALKLLLPFRLSGEYDAPVPGGLFDAHALAGLAVLALVLYGVYRYRRRPELLLGTGILLLGLLPVLNIVPIGEVSAERFLYIPSLGFVLVLAAVFTDALAVRHPAARGGRNLMKPSLAGPLTMLLAVTLVAYAARTVTRNADWKNETTLFAKTAASSPNSARAQLGVGGAAERRGDIPAAIAAYQRALAIDPDYPDALSNLAGIYVRQGRIDEAQAMIQRALRTAPNNPRLITNLGAIYFQKKQFELAAEQFERVVALDPNEREARFNLALIRFQQERFADAKGHLEAVAGKGERFNLAFFYLAVIESGAGNQARAQQLARHFLTVHRHNDAFRTRAQEIAGP